MDEALKEKLRKLLVYRYQAVNKLLSEGLKEYRQLKRELRKAK